MDLWSKTARHFLKKSLSGTSIFRGKSTFWTPDVEEVNNGGEAVPLSGFLAPVGNRALDYMALCFDPAQLFSCPDDHLGLYQSRSVFVAGSGWRFISSFGIRYIMSSFDPVGWYFLLGTVLDFAG